MKTWGMVAVLVAVVLVVALRSHSATSTAPVPCPTTAGAQPVSAEHPKLREVPNTLSVTGTISARDELSIGAEVNGLRLTSVRVDEGMFVRHGEILATLDNSVLQAQLHEAQARLTESRASMGKAVQPNRPQDILVLEHALSQARANVEQAHDALQQAQATQRNADLNLQRYTQLLHDDYATEQEYSDHQTEAERDQAGVRAAQDQVRAAEMAVREAQDRLSLARAGGRREDITYATASAEEAAATVEQLQAQLAQTVIMAPDDGLIVKRDAHLGDITSPGKALFTMAREDQLELRAQVPESDLRRVHIGQSVTVTDGGKPVHGRVRLITPTIDPSTRLGTVRIAVPTDSGLVPGMFVHAQLALGITKAMVIPADAVQGSAEQPFVYLLDGSLARRHAVALGRRLQDGVEVAAGLTPDDRVIVAGAAFLTDGDAVTVPHP